MTPLPDPAQPLKNQRHEAIAQAVASGKTQRDAVLDIYVNAKNWTHPNKAAVKGSEICARPEVRARIGFLQAQGAENAGYTLAAHLARLDALSKAAEKNADYAAAVRAERSRGEAAGFYLPKSPLTETPPAMQMPVSPGTRVTFYIPDNKRDGGAG